MQDDDQSTQHMVRADLLTGLVILALGLAVTWLSWEMPRLTTRGIHPATAPGLVPGLLGIALAVCGAIVALRSVRALGDAAGWAAFARLFAGSEAARVGGALVLAMIYAIGLVGWLPFWAATALFVFAFILLFEQGFGASEQPLLRTVATAAVQAILVAIVVTLVFERGFLVRLP
jgi:putative tricarboxylic transport membrane protein